MATKIDENLPAALLAALRRRDVEFPGEKQALNNILAWLGQPTARVVYDEPGPCLPVDRFAWTPMAPSDTGSQHSTTSPT